MQSHYDYAQSRVRFIHPVTQLPYQVGENSHKVPNSMSLETWHANYAIYVDLQGRLLHLKGRELDAAIAEGKKMSDTEKRLGENITAQRPIAITDNEWRLLHISDNANYSQSKERYIDALSGLPPVDDKGTLITITPFIARPKITCGEWITIKYFINSRGHYFYSDKNNKPTELTGSQLQKAIDDKEVKLSCTKLKAKGAKKDHSDPLRTKQYQPKLFKETPPQKIPESHSAPVKQSVMEWSRETADRLSSSSVSVLSQPSNNSTELFEISKEECDVLRELNLSIDEVHPRASSDLRSEEVLAQLPAEELLAEIDSWLNHDKEPDDMQYSPAVMKR